MAAEEHGVATSPSLATSRAIQPGRRIGRYEILQHMATGGMAEIYLARATGLEHFEKLCVIKRVLPSVAGNPELVSMLLDEARIAATLHHSNIVQVFDIGQADGEYFIAMEYLHGRDVAAVARVLRQRGLRLAEDQAMSIILAVCAGLHYAHERTDEHDRPLGIVHRDVSPSNVIVTFDGSVKLVDFGLVKAEGRATESRSGSLKGKLAYMSPEQCRAKPCDRRSDVFSLAIVLWELTTGQRLYTGECDYDYLTAILERDAKRPSEVIPDYSPQLETIVMKGLARDPDARYQTAEDFQLVLEEYCREHKLKVSPITLRKMMEELFGEEMRSWQAALREGVALEDHLLQSFATGSVHAVARRSEPMDVPVTTPSIAKLFEASRPPAKRRRVVPWIAAIAIAGAGGAGAMYYVGQQPSAETPQPQPQPEPTPQPQPEPTPQPQPTPPAAAAPAAAEPELPPPAPTFTEPPHPADKPHAVAPKAPSHKKPPPVKPTPEHKPPEHKPASDHDSLFPE